MGDGRVQILVTDIQVPSGGRHSARLIAAGHTVAVASTRTYGLRVDYVARLAQPESRRFAGEAGAVIHLARSTQRPGRCWTLAHVVTRPPAPVPAAVRFSGRWAARTISAG